MSACGSLNVQLISSPAHKPIQPDTPLLSWKIRPLDSSTRAQAGSRGWYIYFRKHIDPTGLVTKNAIFTFPHAIPLAFALILPCRWIISYLQQRRTPAQTNPATIRRRLVMLVSILSVVVCLALLTLSVMSFFQQGNSKITYHNGVAAPNLDIPGHYTGLVLLRGRLGIYIGQETEQESRAGYSRAFLAVWQWFPLRNSQHPTGQETAFLRTLGFGYQSSSPPSLPSKPANPFMIILPLYPFILLFALLPAHIFRKRLFTAQQRARLAAGQCPACGYDIRATPTLCPECGASIESLPPPPVP